MTTTTATTDTPTTAANRVTVLGLGTMGSAIATAFVERGYRTTVWNRTAGKSAPLVDVGATVAATAAEAVAASPLVVVCLLDGAAVDEVLASVDDVVAGKVLVNLTSGSPAQARATERWAGERGAEYLDGKLMGDPPYVGTPNFTVLLSGSRSAFDAHESALRVLGGVGYHGEDPGFAAVEFMAQVAMGYEMLIGFLHVLKLVRAEGGDVTEFAERFAGSLAVYPPLLTGIAKAVASGEHPPDLGPLRVQAALMDRRIADGHGEQGFSSLFELLAKEG
ncbi:NAD(P)-dependent oxidoreductase [Nonomuraea sp. AD125B]|uniref:NAD(P)-dependent oxidoreductase n=1 Tax=Nonomuraea sp. AD125B TaxID=3242897 RepID=UPI003527DC21